MPGVKMKGMLGQMVAVAVVLTVAALLGSGPARAEFHQPLFQNGFGLDSQLPLMPNHHHHHVLEDHILAAATASSQGAELAAQLPNLLAADQLDDTVVYNSSYTRRKEQLMPLITDLIRGVRGGYEVYEAYVLNVDHQLGMERNGTRNETATVVTSVVIDSSFGGSVGGAVGGSSGAVSSEHSAEGLEQLLLNDMALFELGGSSDEQNHVDGSTMSILEQNLADLNDFCDSGESNHGTSPYYRFNNSFNLIPKDLLEATDLFWSTTPSTAQTVTQQVGASAGGDGDGDRSQSNGTRAAEALAEGNSEDNLYLRFIKKEGGDEEEEEEQCSETVRAPVKEEDEADSGLENETDVEEPGRDATPTTGIKYEEDEEEEEEEDGIIVKLEAFEENDLIEELTEDSAEGEDSDQDQEERVEQVVDSFEFTVKEEQSDEEEQEEEQKVQVEDEPEPRDFFLNGNEVFRRPLTRSSTFEDFRLEDFEDEVIAL